jgi:succinate dehydrogenase hydrophobic anchor subunit
MQKKIRVLAIASAVFLCIDVIALIGLTVFVVSTRNKFLEIFKDFKITLPIMTRIALWSHYIFIIVALVLIAKEWSKRKLTTLITNIVVFFILSFCIYLYVLGLFLPIYQISQSGQ